MIEFEWDSHNLKHIIEDYPERDNTVEEVQSVFSDPDIIIQTGRKVAGEQRFDAFGIGISGTIRFVVYKFSADKIRPITCWPANKQTIRKYESIKREKDR